jgi:hypothetical protein
MEARAIGSLPIVWDRSAVATPQGAWCGSHVASRRRSAATPAQAPRRSRGTSASVSSWVAKTFRESCEEHLSVLNDEMVSGRPGADESELDDLQEQIDHWQALQCECDCVLGRAAKDAM